MKYLAIGDSNTADMGWGITIYPQLLGANLPTLHPEAGFGPYTEGYQVAGAGVVNHGHGGWATQDYPVFGIGKGHRELWTTEALNENADIVSIMLGTNDHYSDDQIIPRVDIDDYEANLRWFVDQLRSVNPNVDIILIAPPPIETAKFTGSPINKGDNARVSLYADRVEAVAAAKSVRFIHLFDSLWSLSGQNETTFGSTYTTDGIHLNNAGQLVLYNLLLPEIEPYINIGGIAHKALSPGEAWAGPGQQHGGKRFGAVLTTDPAKGRIAIRRGGVKYYLQGA